MKILFLAILSTIAKGQVCRILPDSALSEVGVDSSWEVSWQPKTANAASESELMILVLCPLLCSLLEGLRTVEPGIRPESWRSLMHNLKC